MSNSLRVKDVRVLCTINFVVSFMLTSSEEPREYMKKQVTSFFQPVILKTTAIDDYDDGDSFNM